MANEVPPQHSVRVGIWRISQRCLGANSTGQPRAGICHLVLVQHNRRLLPKVASGLAGQIADRRPPASRLHPTTYSTNRTSGGGVAAIGVAARHFVTCVEIARTIAQGRGPTFCAMHGYSPLQNALMVLRVWGGTTAQPRSGAERGLHGLFYYVERSARDLRKIFNESSS